MNFPCILAAVGLIALAALAGIILAKIEKKAMEELRDEDTYSWD